MPAPQWTRRTFECIKPRTLRLLYESEHMSTLTPPVTAPIALAAPSIITLAIIILAGAELRRIVGAEPTAPFARAQRCFGDLTVELRAVI